MTNRFFKIKKSGFTLVEIMIVVFIIALLAAIAIPNFTRHTRRAKASEAVASMSMIRQAMRDYFINTGEHFNITTGRIDDALPDSVTAGVPTPITAGVDLDIGGQLRVAQFFSNPAFTVDDDDAGGFDANGLSNLFANPSAVDFIISVTGLPAVNPTCGNTDCAINAGVVEDYRLEMDNTGRVFVSYDGDGGPWESY